MAKYCKKPVFAFLFVLCNNIFAQTSASKPYAAYYEAVNRAELAIAEFKWKQALCIFDSVFAVFPKHHNRDLYNASLCALLCNKHQRAQTLIIEQIAKGATIDGFTSDVFKQQSILFWQPIEHCYDSLRNVFEAEVKRWKWFKTELESMDEKEQQAVGDENLSLSGYHLLIYANTKRLYRIIDSAGIPPIALFEKKQMLPVAVLKRHFKLRDQLRNGALDRSSMPYSDMDMERYDLEPLLIRAVFDGDLLPDWAYGYVHGIRDDLHNSLYDVKIDMNTRTIRIVENKYADIAKENAKLACYGLPPLSDAMKKDVEMLLYYNEDNYPFDAHIEADMELGYTTNNYNTLQDFKSKKELLEKRMEKYFSVKSNYLASLSKHRLPNSESIPIFNSLLVLKDFKLTTSPGLYIVSEMPLNQ